MTKNKILKWGIIGGLILVAGINLVLYDINVKIVNEDTSMINQGIDYKYIEAQRPLDEAKTKLAHEANGNKYLK